MDAVLALYTHVVTLMTIWPFTKQFLSLEIVVYYVRFVVTCGLLRMF